MPLSVGQYLYNKRYRIDKLLGQGGMGAVYKVWDYNLDITLAIKENLDISLESQEQFGREAKILARLSHPNLPRVTDHFVIPDQGQYLVMDFVKGDNLQEMLGRVGVLPENLVLNWTKQICAALSYLHIQDPPIIHRDIKPANIRITPEGKAMLVDFGIAKIFDPHLQTTIGARAITPGYSPQEQYGAGKTDMRTDVYALGATLYNLLTGEKPPESIQRAINTQLIPPRQLNPQLSEPVEMAIIKSMQLHPDQRYQSISDFNESLTKPIQQTVSQQETVVVSPAAKPTDAHTYIDAPSFKSTQKRKIPMLVYLAGGFGLLLIIGICLFLVWGFSISGEAPTETALPTLQPSFTSESISTATSTQAPVPQELKIPFFEDFSNPNSDVWWVGEDNDIEHSFQNNGYQIQINKEYWSSWNTIEAIASDVIIEVDVMNLGVDNNDAGVICRNTDDDTFYQFLISSDGFYKLGKLNGDEWIDIIEWTESDKINTGQSTNHIKAICEGSQLSLYVNNHFLASTEDHDFSNGSIGVITSSYDEPGVDVIFDNFYVYIP
jgi:serine/threonine-protein kinase